MTWSPAEWPTGRPRVLVTDAWLANAGDAAIALATQQMIRSTWPDAATLHAAYHVDLVGSNLPELDFVPPLDSLLGVQGAHALPGGWVPEVAELLVREADLIVSQGGGFLSEHYQPWPRLFAHARVVELGLPFAYLGQTIGHFSAARARALLRQALTAARVVSVRDRSSLQHVTDLGVDPDHVVLTSDVTLTLFPVPPPAGVEARDVAVILSAHDYGANGADPAALSARLLAEVLERVDDADRVTVLSTTQGLGREGIEDDSVVAREAVAALDGATRERVDAIDRYLGPRDIMTRVAGMRAVVSQRLHPGLFALASGVPAALLTESNGVGVLEGVDLGAARCPDPTDPLARAVAIDAVLAPDALQGRALWEALSPARERAERNRSVLIRSLEVPT